MIDISGRQSEETKLRESIIDLKEVLTKQYQRNLHEKVHGGVSGAGMTRSTFFDTLGLSGIAKNVKEKAEAKEIDRVNKEAFIANFQDNTEAGKMLSGDTARKVATDLYYQQKSGSSEAAIEASEQNENQIELQKKTSDDITDLYTITDDHFKETEKYQKRSIELLEEIAQSSGSSGKGLLGTAAEMAGDLMGGKGKGAGKVGKLAGVAGKLGTIAKVGGGLLAVGTAAYDAYGDYSAADEAVKSGEITKEEGKIRKGEAVGGGVGAAGGALAGAKAGAMLGAFGGPIGMAIGGLLGGTAGYFGGKFLGKKTGGAIAGASGSLTADSMASEGFYDSQPTDNITGDIPKTVTSNFSAKRVTLPEQASPEINRLTGAAKDPNYIEKERGGFGSYSKEYLQKVVNGEVPRALISKEKAEQLLQEMEKKDASNLTPVPPSEAGEIKIRRRSLDDASAKDVNTENQVNNVNAPSNTTIVNNNIKNDQRSSKNNDSSFQKYLDRRYHPVGA